MIGPHSLSFSKLIELSAVDSNNTNKYQYITLSLKDQTTVDVIINSFKDCLHFLIAVSSHVVSDFTNISSRRCLSLLMIKMKLF